MFTPEEVQNYSARGNDWGNYDNTEILCLEKSDWLTSFKERHLQNCKHYRVMFYDEFLDIICEGIESFEGSYRAEFRASKITVRIRRALTRRAVDWATLR